MPTKSVNIAKSVQTTKAVKPKQSATTASVETASVETSADDALHAVCGCGCASGDASSGRKALHVDADIKARNTTRLRRIEGQVRGIQKMVADDRYCADILTQISSVHEALRAVGRELMRNHLKHCASSAMQGTTDDANAMYDELVELMYRHSR